MTDTRDARTSWPAPTRSAVPSAPGDERDGASSDVIAWFADVSRADVARVGGKGANLGELTRAGLAVPPGFVVTAPAYLRSIESGGVRAELAEAEEPLVSSDIVGSPASCTFDAPLTLAMGNMVKVLGWYDNECGYANRLVDLAVLIGAAAA